MREYWFSLTLIFSNKYSNLPLYGNIWIKENPHNMYNISIYIYVETIFILQLLSQISNNQRR